MKTNNKTVKLLSFAALIAFAIVMLSCGRNNKNKEVTIDIRKTVEMLNNNGDEDDAIMCLEEYFRNPSTKIYPDLSAYMDSISQYTEVPLRYPDYDMKIVQKAYDELQRFKVGKNKYYPKEEVIEALDLMAFEIGYYHSHGGLVFYPSLIYWFSFANQAALLCPDVDFISNVHSNDHNIGVLSYHGWSIWPMMSYLIQKKENHCTIQLIDLEVRIKKIFEIKTKMGKEYYLLTSDPNTSEDNTSYLDIYLYEKSDNGATLITKCNSGKWIWDIEDYGYNEFPDISRDKDVNIIYNPKKYQWDVCTKKGQYWHKIEGTKSLYLVLDAKTPYFEIR